MYPEDFNEPADFPALNRLIQFGRDNKIIDLRGRAHQLREAYKHMAIDGRFVGQLFYG